ncbi:MULTISPECIES: hypothetical protein [unclassified Bradyrhizobium]|uniref:hypothetical protein n=1 Tax=unclassified Bradyrhizobium TaxID=2631580 RepID=UPI00247A40FC|nr:MULTISPECIES: hypothetical protein [unclassified Bradyrhizobium]WGS23329.1 hypothetical protein MTX22_17885 [Bradyrhizobium sp. ISRA463]WGS30339.1 hypothetical protein MTX19_15610 [Bradyrhizobium sp. ISRA464]
MFDYLRTHGLTMELPHWLIATGGLFMVVGIIGLLSRSSKANENSRETVTPAETPQLVKAQRPPAGSSDS